MLSKQYSVPSGHFTLTPKTQTPTLLSLYLSIVVVNMVWEFSIQRCIKVFCPKDNSNR